MIKHDRSEDTGFFSRVYRWNTDLKQWEFWLDSNEYWKRSMWQFRPSHAVIVEYSDTWAEPFFGMNNE